MNLPDTAIPALISAVSGLFGVLVGTSIPIIREFFGNRRKRFYLVVRVVCILDKFVEDCAKAIDQDSQAAEMPISSWPTTLDFPGDLDWRLLDGKQLYRILALPNRVNVAAADVNFIADVASTEHDPQHLDTVNKRYTPLGLEAASLAKALRQQYGLPPVVYSDWEPLSALQRMEQTLNSAGSTSKANG